MKPSLLRAVLLVILAVFIYAPNLVAQEAVTPSMGSGCCTNQRPTGWLYLSPDPGFRLAQEATITTPVTRNSEAKMTARSFCATQAAISIEVSVQDSGNAEIRVTGFTVPDPAHPTATVAGFFTALDTIRATETGGVLRKANFRILGFLFDNGYLPGVTLAP